MKRRHLSLLSLALAISVKTIATEAIMIDESRPLAKLTVRLVQQYGYLVTYEEAPYDEGTLRTDVRSNGGRFRYPSWNPGVFNIPDQPRNGTHAGSPAPTPEIPLLGPEVLQPILKEYEDSGSPGKFRAVFEGGYAHILPSTRIVDGRAQDFEPILSTRIPFTSGARSCNEALNDLFFRLKTVRGVTVVAAAIPISGLMRQECTVVGDDLAARDVLLQILEQVGALSSPKIRFAWGLFYDANGDKYFLSTIPVPDMTPLGTEAQGQQANKTALPVTATPPTSGNRTGVPASKK